MYYNNNLKFAYALTYFERIGWNNMEKQDSEWRRTAEEELKLEW